MIFTNKWKRRVEDLERQVWVLQNPPKFDKYAYYQGKRYKILKKSVSHIYCMQNEKWQLGWEYVIDDQFKRTVAEWGLKAKK